MCVCLKGMFALGWLELGDAERAQKLLQKCFKNIQKPFQVCVCTEQKLVYKLFRSEIDGKFNEVFK